ncbi:MAG: hypothetical protein EXQ56_08615 [Acidobacteria bacterium]|nr:hypothetical protein [Acidobacteriota bacterium]
MGEAIFRFLFKYPPIAFERGRVTLASGWPVWLLIILALGGAAALGYFLWRQKSRLPLTSKLMVWGAQSITLAILLLLLWRPALVLSSLVPQRNVLAVLVDDSSSMALTDEGTIPRVEQVRQTFADDGALLAELREKFQVRTYSFSNQPRKLITAADLQASGKSSRVEEAVGQIYGELRHLPLAGVVVVSDGAQNAGKPSPENLQEMLARKIPIYTLGVGNPQMERDIEVTDIVLPRTALPGSTVTAAVSLRQHGYIGRAAKVELREGNRLLKSRTVEFGPSPVETVNINFTPETKGIREYTVVVSPAGGPEPIMENNAQSRVVEVQDRVAKILYIEGEPRWEYKFLRRAMEEDKSFQIASVLRTSQNKFYRQGIENPKELATGIPSMKELFQYDGLILGSIQASFFSPEQQRSIYEFVSRRGGGLLMLGGRMAFADGGYQASTLADLLPVELDNRGATSTLHRLPAKFRLTARGMEKIQINTGTASDDTASQLAWDKLPQLANYQTTGKPKPGAVVLGEGVNEGGDIVPLLIAEHFGRGRTALFATDSSWRWQMQMPSEDHSHEFFWRQLLSSMVTETPRFVSVMPEKPLYADEETVRLVGHVYDEQFEPVNAAEAVATVNFPDGSKQEVLMTHSVEEDGVFYGEMKAAPAGIYNVELSAKLADKQIGTSSAYFQRADGVVEHFSPELNAPFLSRMAEQTGGKYYPLAEAGKLPEQLTYSPAGVSVPEVRDLWDMPLWLLLILMAKGIEWMMRKRWRTV